MRAFLLIASVLNVMNYEMCSGLKIAAFNIQNFGPTKMSKSDVVEILAQVRTHLRVYVTFYFFFTWPLRFTWLCWC